MTTRSTELLFAFPVTIDCALGGCVPCGYKIGLFDVALDKEFCKSVPNQRPEQCPRMFNWGVNIPDGDATVGPSTNYASPGMKVLTVGDGDFSFSLAVARKLFSTASQGEAAKQSTLIATSYESEETLRKVYPDFDRTLRELRGLGADVYYEVDGTALGQSLHSGLLEPETFDRICWNFPCTAIGKGQDGQNDAMEENKELVRSFVANSTPLLRPQGEIHICHKSKPPFNQWRLDQVALEKLHATESTGTISFCGRIILDRATLPTYTPRKALDRKSFPCHDACFYIFAKQSTSTSPAGTASPTTIPKTGSVRSDKDRAPLPVSPETIGKIRDTLLSAARTRKHSAQNRQRAKRRRVSR